MLRSRASQAITNDHTESILEVGKGGGISLLSNIIGQILRFGFHIMLGRMLGPSSYGLYNLGRSILEISHLVGIAGLQNSVVRFLAIFRGEGDAARVRGTIVYATAMVVTLSISVGYSLWYLSNWLSKEIFVEPTLGLVLQAFAIVLPFYSLMMLLTSCFRGFRNMKYYNGTLNIAHPLCTLALTAAAFWNGMTLDGALWGFILSTALTALLSVRLTLNLFPQLFMIGKGCLFETKRILNYTLKTAAIDFSKPLLRHQTDHILLGLFGVVRDVGIYSVGYLVSGKITMFQHVFNGIFAPVVADFYNRGKHDQLSEIFKTVSKWTLLLTLPLFFALVFIGPLIVDLFGRGFAEAWTIIEILAIANLINISAGPVGFMLIMTGRPGVELFNVSMVGLGNILLNAWLIPRFGVVGAAIGTGFSMVIINFVRLAEVYKILNCHPFRMQTLKVLSAFGLSYVAIWSLNQFFQVKDWWSVTLIMPFLLLYGGLLTLFGWDDDDRHVFGVFRNKLYVRSGGIKGNIGANTQL